MKANERKHTANLYYQRIMANDFVIVENLGVDYGLVKTLEHIARSHREVLRCIGLSNDRKLLTVMSRLPKVRAAVPVSNPKDATAIAWETRVLEQSERGKAIPIADIPG